MFIIKITIEGITSPMWATKPPTATTWLTGYAKKARKFKTAGAAATWAINNEIGCMATIQEVK